MQAEILRQLVDVLRADLATNEIIASWDKLVASVEGYLEDPNSETIGAVATAREEAKTKLGKSIAARMPASWSNMISELKLNYYDKKRLDQLVDGLASDNALAVQDRLKELKDIQEWLKGDSDAFEKIDSAFNWLGIEPANLPENEAEVTATIPRIIFGNDLAGLQDEISDLDHLLKLSSEIVTGQSPESTQIRSFSTSEPTFWLATTPAVAYFIMKLVHSILDAYGKVLSLRKMKAELLKMDPETLLAKQLDDQAMKIIEGTSKTFVDYARQRFMQKKGDQGRVNELCNGLKLVVESTAAKMDNGFRLEARIGVEAERSEGAQEATPQKETSLSEKELEEFRQMETAARNFSIEGQPILNLPKPKSGKSKGRGRKKDEGSEQT